jgi:hypothetical protein
MHMAGVRANKDATVIPNYSLTSIGLIFPRRGARSDNASSTPPAAGTRRCIRTDTLEGIDVGLNCFGRSNPRIHHQQRMRMFLETLTSRFHVVMGGVAGRPALVWQCITL